MSILGHRARNTHESDAPENYVPGLGRGAVGFTTRSDIGPARNPLAPEGLAAAVAGAGPFPPIAMARGRGRGMDVAPNDFLLPISAGRGSGTAGMGGFGRETDENEDFGDYSESNYDEFSGYTGTGLFQDTPYDKDDEEADTLYEMIDERMDSRRKRRREMKILQEVKKARQERPKIADQFLDLKESLKTVSDEQWAQIPDIGDRSLKHKTNTAIQIRNQMFVPTPDHLIGSSAGLHLNKDVSSGSITPSILGGIETPGTSTSVTGLAEARGAVLSLKLDKMSDSIMGQTVVDPKGYLTDLNSLKITTDVEIGDIKKARLLLHSVTTTNPKHGPGWIAAARLEEVAGKIVQARKLIRQGCESCSTQEDVWLEAARLQSPENAKGVLAKAIRHVPASTKVWLQAAKLENDIDLKKLVLRRALEFLPTSVKLWKALIELEDTEGARLLLGRAVECVPQSVDLWLALARLETYENAKMTLNKARFAVPSDPMIWITAAKLEEAQGKSIEMIERILRAAVKSLKKHQVEMSRDSWLKEAEACEKVGAILTCGAIVRTCLEIGVEAEDRKRTWMDDADTCITHNALHAAKAIYAHALSIFPGKKSIWLRAIALEKQIVSERQTSDANSCSDKVDTAVIGQLLDQAVRCCPNAEVLWLMSAKEAWTNGSVENARLILRQAFSANPNSEAIWLAAVKLEWENDEIELARALLAKARAHAPSAQVWMKSILLEREVGTARLEEEKLLKEGVTRFPDSPKLHMMAGQFYEHSDPPDYTEAKRRYRTGIQQCPKCMHLWILSSRLEEKVTGVTKARSVLELARLKSPKNDVLWLESIRLEARVGNSKGQNMLLSKALQVCPDSGILLAESIEIAARPHQKRASFAALKRKDNDPSVCLAVAKLFWQERKYTKARKWLERTVQLQSEFGDGWAYYYLFETKHGITTNAPEKILRRCIEAEPKYGEHWTQFSKQTEHRRKPIADIIKLVSSRIPHPHI